MRIAFLILLLAGSAFAQSVAVVPAPSGLYTLEYLAWDSPGCTNWQVLVRTQTNALPVLTFEKQVKITAITNLQFGVQYWLSVKAQSNQIWSAESDLYAWPHKREDYFTVQNFTASSPTATKLWLPDTIKTFTNLPVAAMIVGSGAWISNNITPYIVPQ